MTPDSITLHSIPISILAIHPHPLFSYNFHMIRNCGKKKRTKSEKGQLYNYPKAIAENGRNEVENKSIFSSGEGEYRPRGRGLAAAIFLLADSSLLFWKEQGYPWIDVCVCVFIDASAVRTIPYPMDPTPQSREGDQHHQQHCFPNPQ